MTIMKNTSKLKYINLNANIDRLYRELQDKVTHTEYSTIHQYTWKGFNDKTPNLIHNVKWHLKNNYYSFVYILVLGKN